LHVKRQPIFIGVQRHGVAAAKRLENLTHLELLEGLLYQGSRIRPLHPHEIQDHGVPAGRINSVGHGHTHVGTSNALKSVQNADSTVTKMYASAKKLFDMLKLVINGM
jgi:hypothetical protein